MEVTAWDCDGELGRRETTINHSVGVSAARRGVLGQSNIRRLISFYYYYLFSPSIPRNWIYLRPLLWEETEAREKGGTYSRTYWAAVHSLPCGAVNPNLVQKYLPLTSPHTPTHAIHLSTDISKRPKRHSFFYNCCYLYSTPLLYPYSFWPSYHHCLSLSAVVRPS